MKKFLLIVLCLMFTNLTANATTIYVRNNIAGVPVSVTRGAGMPMSMSRAQAMYGQRYSGYGYRRSNVYQGMRNNYYPRTSGCGNNSYVVSTVAPITPVAPVSRLSKDYTIKQRNSYVANGVRYYN